MICCASTALAQDRDGDGVADSADAYPCAAQLSGALYAPGQNLHAALMFEDTWPALGDADFNDAVITYNYVFQTNPNGDIVGITATYTPVALGGNFDNGLGIGFPLLASNVASVTRTVGNGTPQPLTPMSDSQLTVRLSNNLREFYGNQAGPINAVPGSELPSQIMQVDVQLSTPVAASMVTLAPFDVFLFRSADPTHEIHAPSYAGTSNMNPALFGTADDRSNPQSGVYFVDNRGLSFVLDVPVFDVWPQEGVDIAQLMPNIVNFALSGGGQSQDFYTNGLNPSQAFSSTPVAQPGFLPGHELIDLSCLGALPGCMANADFESGSAGWTATGSAFAGFPFTSCHNSGTCFGSAGISTLNNGEAATGSLTSAPFQITTNQICWQNGGFEPSYTAIDVGANGSQDITVVARGRDGSPASGDNWGIQCADVSPHIGETAQVVLVDNDSNGGFAWASWDNFTCQGNPGGTPSTPAPPTSASCPANGDFESGTAGWTPTANAFNNFPHTNCGNAGSCFGSAGISTLRNGEPAVGTLVSDTFTISQRLLCWQNGGFGPSYTALDLDADGSEDMQLVARGVYGNSRSGDGWGEQCFDLGAFIGRSARLILADNNSGGGYAWAAWDNIGCRDN